VEHLDESITAMVRKGNKREESVRNWEEQLAEMVEKIPNEESIELGKEEYKMGKLFLFDGALSVYIPEQFIEMPLDDVKLKYIHELKPQLVFENEKRTVNIGLFISEEKIEKSQLPDIRNIMKDTFIKLNPVSKVFDHGEFITKCENDVAYYTFDSPALVGQMFSLVFIAALGEKTLICNLNCIKKDMDEMKLLLYGIMKTMRFDCKSQSEVLSTHEGEIDLFKFHGIFILRYDK